MEWLHALLLIFNTGGVFWMLGLSGARLTAICELLEADITDRDFTVLTKFRERVTYPMTPDIAEIIRFAREFKADHEIDSQYLFVKTNGRPWRKDSFNNRLVRIAAKHSLSRITSHQLRHMAGTIAAEKGLSVDQIQALLAQKSRESSEEYIDQTSAMRETGLTAVGTALRLVGNLSENVGKSANRAIRSKTEAVSKVTKKNEAVCPQCGCKFCMDKE